MKSTWIKSEGNAELIMFFGGFATDENLLRNIEIPSECDLVLMHDYRTGNFDFDFANFSKVYVIAWSFGVWVANYLRKKIPATKWIAVNWSQFPVDGGLGIAYPIFEKTLETFDSANWDKFFKRICGGIKEAENLKDLKQTSLSVEELKSELEALGDAFQMHGYYAGEWTTAIASKDDKIFSIKNMALAWSKKLIIIDGNHLNPNAISMAFSLLKPHHKVKRSFEKKIDVYNEYGFVQKEISNTLSEFVSRILHTDFSPKNILEVGCGTGFLTRIFARKFASAKWWINDLSARMCAAAAIFINGECTILEGDISECKLPENLDLIMSSSCLQWVADKKKVFNKFAQASTSGGLLVFSTFGKKNYLQIKNILGKSLDYHSLDETVKMLEDCGYGVLYASEEVLEVEFDSPKHILKHIKNTGVNGGFSEFWTPSKMRSFIAEYESKFSKNGKSILTYNPIYIVAQKKS